MPPESGSRERIEQVIKALARNNLNGYYASTRAEAFTKALSFIPAGALVGAGNSLTLRETGIYQELVQGDCNFIDQFEKGIDREEAVRRRKAGLSVDIYFSSTNAITLDGKLVNIDGKGNRVAALMYGPDKVVFVVGRNKIVDSEQAAWDRAQLYSAPLLAKRFGLNTPCTKTGKCSDCHSPERICRYYTIIGSHMPADRDRTHVILIDEDLGL